MVKTDGRRIVAITNNHLSVIDVTGRRPLLVGSMALSPELSVRDMFLRGDTVVLLGNTWGPMPTEFIDIGFGVDEVGIGEAGDLFFIPAAGVPFDDSSFTAAQESECFGSVHV